MMKFQLQFLVLALVMFGAVLAHGKGKGKGKGNPKPKPKPKQYISNFCADKVDGLYADPTSCSNFIQCANYITYTRPCAPGTVWNPVEGVCDHPENVPGCAPTHPTNQPPDTCETGFLQSGTTCYYFSRDQVNHYTGNSYCMLLGAKLVTIESGEEDEFILDHVSDSKYHIGGSDLRFEGKFYWMNPQKEIEGYTNWAEGNPENLRGKKNCMMLDIFANYKWINRPCGYMGNFICEKPL